MKLTKMTVRVDPVLMALHVQMKWVDSGENFRNFVISSLGHISDVYDPPPPPPPPLPLLQKV